MPTADMVNGLSIQTKSSFAGISIEMSVTNQICEYRPSRVLGVRLFAVRGLVRRNMAPRLLVDIDHYGVYDAWRKQAEHSWHHTAWSVVLAAFPGNGIIVYMIY